MIKQVFISGMFLASFGSMHSMEKQHQELTPHNAEIAILHEKALRGFKRSRTRDIQMLTSAIAYFDTHDHPNREFLLHQCQAAKYLIHHYVPKIQAKFQRLLALEQEHPDSSRWAKIQQVLPLDRSINLHPNEQFITHLINLAHDTAPSHEKWIHILTQTFDQSQEKEQERTDSVAEKHDNEEEDISSEEKTVQIIKKPQQQKIPQKNNTSRKVSKKKKNSSQKKKKKKQNKTQASHAPNPSSNPQVASQTKQGLNKLLWGLLQKKDHEALGILFLNHKNDLEVNARHADSNFTPLLYAVSVSDAASCDLLLKHGANVEAPWWIKIPDCQDQVRLTPLALAVNQGALTCACALLHHKANPNASLPCRPSGSTEHILSLAASDFDPEQKLYTQHMQENMIKLLLKSGATEFSGSISLINPETKQVFPLDLKEEEDQTIIEYVLEQGSETSIMCKHGNIVLVHAFSLNTMSPEDTSVEEEQTAQEELPSKELRDQFWDLLETNKLKEAQELLTAQPELGQCSILLQDNKQLTPLAYAVSENNKEMCRMLLASKVNPNTPCILLLSQYYGRLRLTPLTLAVSLGLVECVKELLLHGADPNILATYLESGVQEHPLAIISSTLKPQDEFHKPSIRLEIIKLLLQHGAHDRTCRTFFYNLTTTCGYELNLAHAQHQALLPLILKDTIAVDFKENSYILVGISLDEKVAKKLTPFAIMDPQFAQQKRVKNNDYFYCKSTR